MTDEKESPLKLSDIKKRELKDDLGNVHWSYICKTCGSTLLSVPVSTVNFINAFERTQAKEKVTNDVREEE